MFPFNRLYPILDTGFCEIKKIDLFALPSLWEANGIDFYQLRAKDLSQNKYLLLAKKLKSAYPRMKIIANDFVSLALENPTVFSGVHLGQEDLADLGSNLKTALAKHSLTADFICGISTHNFGQFEKAMGDVRTKEINWSYIAIGPVYPTESKKDTAQIISETELTKMLNYFSQIRFPPFTEPALIFIGGITEKNIFKILTLLSKFSGLKYSFASISFLAYEDGICLLKEKIEF